MNWVFLLVQCIEQKFWNHSFYPQNLSTKTVDNFVDRMYFLSITYPYITVFFSPINFYASKK